MSHNNQITIDHALPPAEATEVARLWVVHQGPSFSYINAAILPDPSHYGMLLADAAMQGAKAYAQGQGVSESEAMAKIWAAIEQERHNHTGDIQIAKEEGEI
jgi:hypothetical protein